MFATELVTLSPFRHVIEQFRPFDTASRNIIVYISVLPLPGRAIRATVKMNINVTLNNFEINFFG